MEISDNCACVAIASTMCSFNFTYLIGFLPHNIISMGKQVVICIDFLHVRIGADFCRYTCTNTVKATLENLILKSHNNLVDFQRILPSYAAIQKMK